MEYIPNYYKQNRPLLLQLLVEMFGHTKINFFKVFTKEENELESHFDKWIYFLKKLDTFDDIPTILKEPIFEKAFKSIFKLIPMVGIHFKNPF